jgi:putative PIN family toxin of toxin-antitoxin system
MRAYILDTNVVVSGLLTSDSSSPPARLLDAMMSGRARFLISHELLAEYRAVLLRPAIARRHGLNANEVDTLLEEIAVNCAVRRPAADHPEAPDPGDAHLWSLVAAEPDAALVTGDRTLVEAAPHGWRILLPADATTELGL